MTNIKNRVIIIGILFVFFAFFFGIKTVVAVEDDQEAKVRECVATGGSNCERYLNDDEEKEIDKSLEDPECEGYLSPGMIDIINVIFFTLQILAPSLLIILGGIDLIRAITSGDDENRKAIYKSLSVRFGAAVGILLVATIIKFVAGIAGIDYDCGRLFTDEIRTNVIDEVDTYE